MCQFGCASIVPICGARSTLRRILFRLQSGVIVGEVEALVANMTFWETESNVSYVSSSLHPPGEK